MVTPGFQLACWAQRGFVIQPVSVSPPLNTPGPWGPCREDVGVGGASGGPCHRPCPGLCAGGFGSHPAAHLSVRVCSLAGLWAGWSEWTDGQFGGANEATQCYHRLSLLTDLDEAIIIPEHCSIPGFHAYHPRTPPHKIILFPVPLLQCKEDSCEVLKGMIKRRKRKEW